MAEPAAIGNADVELVCSAKGCRAAAAHQLRWNNPKLHAPDTRKTWLACDAHREHLGDFLGARRFLREVLPLATAGSNDPIGGAGPPAGGTVSMTP